MGVQESPGSPVPKCALASRRGRASVLSFLSRSGVDAQGHSGKCDESRPKGVPFTEGRGHCPPGPGKRPGHAFRGQMKQSLRDSPGVAGTEECGGPRGGQRAGSPGPWKIRGSYGSEKSQDTPLRPLGVAGWLKEKGRLTLRSHGLQAGASCPGVAQAPRRRAC